MAVSSSVGFLAVFSVVRVSAKVDRRLELEWRDVYSDNIIVFRGWPVAFTKTGLISSPSKKDPKEQLWS
jgi:hypothetical protein